MIDRDQVLHVAKLARLELSDEEVERMARELNGVLGHIETISELSLDDVPPTSHVIEVENVLRPDDPRPSWPLERVLESAPDPAKGGFRVPISRPVSNPTDLTGAGAASALCAGDLSAAELFDAHRERIAALDGDLGSFLWTDDEAAEAPAGSPLAGTPIAIKDIFCTEGVPTTAASRILEGYRPPYTSTAVRRLREAGAVSLGKTNMDEFAMGSSNENSAYRNVCNPWDRERVPGGSSGGSAAAVSARLAPWAIGTDTGGSIRQPASLCGIVGLKPTYGAISRYGMIAFASSLDQCGPLTRDVTDAALLLKQLVGKDSCDSTAIGLPDQVELPTRSSLEGLRFGRPQGTFVLG